MVLQHLDTVPKKISLNVNIDGLPLFKSSKHQVWPILCNIHEYPNIPPLVVGVYEGTNKPVDLNSFLQPFVDELLELYRNNLKLTTQQNIETTTTVNLRAIICDSPARALIKGVCNFNAKHGCLKCNVVGEYSHVSHTVTFQETNSVRRNDTDFRAKKYGDHHKRDSPFLQLPIDMVEDFPVGDSLHLVDLGIMKRLLFGWRDGNLGKLTTKWSTRDIAKVTQFIMSCRMPREIHRNLRGLHDLSNWKATEYRTFLLYASFIILKDVLAYGPYHHFLNFFCAVTICSSQQHFQFLPIARMMLLYFVEHYRDHYGKEYITSNVHNLIHLVDEVKRFGPLQTFNAYPFENKLSSIKRTIRKGNKPLQQIGNRLMERNTIEIEQFSNNDNNIPVIKTYKYKKTSITMIRLDSFILSTDNQNKWFLTNNNDVFEIISMVNYDTCISFIGNIIQNVSEVFEKPIKSSFLNIFMTNCTSIRRLKTSFNIADIKCKLVVIEYGSNNYYVPLIHTLK
ncbi:uncharacterized protein LOC123869091 [Maniola jurtina]|uniref:uncharacterized protein LOC123869091 n=1 Tax=Maniola jurtina TaxID=191418 RepID=UPI001E685F59|nr:uncharacterized protein LOC123869091 [Maniola jurtina]